MVVATVSPPTAWQQPILHLPDAAGSGLAVSPVEARAARVING